MYRALKSTGKQQERVNLKMNEVRDLRIVKRSDWLSRGMLDDRWMDGWIVVWKQPVMLVNVW